MKKKIVSLFMALTMIFSIIMISPLNVEAADEKPNYTKGVQSYNELESRLDSLKNKYKEKYWTTNGKPSNKDGDTSLHYHGIQCKGFASYIFNDLFCQGYIGPYNDSKYYIPSPKGAKLVEKKWNISSNDTASVKSIISKGQKGDFIQVRRRGKTWGHTMILVSHDNNGLYIFDCNSDGHCKVRYYYQSYKTFAEKNIGMSLYHSTAYPSKKIDKPDQPTITSGEDLSTSSVKIGWKKVSGADKYRIDRRRTDEKNYKTLTSSHTSESYTDKNLKAGTTYYYRVYAINSGGTSPRSVTYEIHTKPNTPRSQKYEDRPMVTTLSDTELKVEWNAVSGADKYKLEFKKSTDAAYKTVDSNIKGTSYIHKGLKSGANYVYRVSAIKQGNIGNEGKRKSHNYESTPSKGKTKFTKLSRPKNVLNEANDKYVDISWKAVQGNHKYAYDVYRDGKPIAQKIKTTSFTDKNATSGYIHKYQIKVLDADDSYKNVSASNEFYAGCKFEQPISIVPDSPTSMKITWNKPNGNADLTYTIKRWNSTKNDYDNIAEKVSGTSYTDKGLKTGETYKYYVQVRDKDGEYVTSTRSKSVVLNIEPSKISLNKTSANLTVGDTLNLSASITPAKSFNKSVSWTSSDNNIVSVSNGTVTAKAAGTANVTVKTANNQTAVCKISVKSKEHIHSYGEWNIEQVPTCLEDGKRVRICSGCSEPDEDTIAAKGHAYSAELQTVKEATCIENGEQARVCGECGDKTDITVIDAKGHTFPDEWTAEGDNTSDCTKQGIEYRLCSICGEREERPSETKEHNYVVTDETEPTLDNPGTRTYTCSDCQNSYSETWVHTINSGTISVEDVAAKPGEQITVPVNVNDNPGIAGFVITVNYDKNKFTPAEVTKSDLISQGTFMSSIDEDGTDINQLKVTWFNDSNVIDDGTLFNIKFNVNPNIAPDTISSVSLDGSFTSASDTELMNVIPNVLSNNITVSDVLRGDINLDRQINRDDLILLGKYLVASDEKKITMFSDAQKHAADVYNPTDKYVIDGFDGILLAKMVAGYELNTSANTIKLFAEESPVKIAVDTSSAVAGEHIFVPVTIEDNAGFAGASFDVNYDKNVLTPVSVSSGDVLSEGTFTSNIADTENKEQNDFIKISWSDSDNAVDNGDLFLIEFAVNDTAQVGDKLPVSLNCNMTDGNFEEISADITHGEIDIVEYADDIIDFIDDDIKNENVYKISDVHMKSSDGTTIENIPLTGSFDLYITLENSDEEFVPAQILAAAYDENDCLLSLKTKDITEDMLTDNAWNIHIDETKKNINTVKIFIWNSLNGMLPQSDAFIISQQTEN